MRQVGQMALHFISAFYRTQSTVVATHNNRDSRASPLESHPRTRFHGTILYRKPEIGYIIVLTSVLRPVAPKLKLPIIAALTPR